MLELERELQTTACRRDRARVLELLAPDFAEVAASGRVWDLASVLVLLASQAKDDEEIEVTQLSGRTLAEASLWRAGTRPTRVDVHVGPLFGVATIRVSRVDWG